MRPSTDESDAGHVNNHLIPAFGPIKLDKLTPVEVRQMMRDVTAQKRSPRTVTYANLPPVLLKDAADALDRAIGTVS